VAAYLPNYNGNISANYLIGNGSQLTGVISTSVNTNTANIAYSVAGANVAGAVANATYAVSAGIASTVLLGSQPNITNVGTLNSLSVTGNIAGNYIFGNGALLSGLGATYSNVSVAAYLPTYTGNIAGGNISVTGNIQGGNLLTSGYVTASGQLYSSSIVTGNAGVRSNLYVSATGNITGGNILSSGQISTSGIISAGALSVTTIENIGGNITSTGNITASYFHGNGSQLTGLPATYGNANVIALLANVGSNQIVSSGTIQGGNLLTTGTLAAATATIRGASPVVSAVNRTITVSNVAPSSIQGSVGDIWYQTV
jgi:hypothetical protein